jgi:cellulose synthase/poly-beta-1,6-N-acetylglucosamine synthase-like glycosyltransferase
VNPVSIAIIVIASFLGIGYLTILLLSYLYGSKAPNIEKGKGFFPRVTVVIPTRNEEEIIKKRLENIINMDYPKDRFEVLFIDGSDDNTPVVIEEYSKRYPFIKLEKQEKPGFNNALNQGYGSAEGEIVVKSDCDAFPERDALMRLVSNFADKRIGAVSGIHRILSNSDGSIEKEFRNIQYRTQCLESYFHSSLLSHGAFAGYQKKLIPELPQAVTADDTEVVLSVIKHGYRAILDPSVVSSEYYPESFKLRREIKDRRAAGVIKVLIKNINLMFNPKYGWVGFLSFPLNFFITVLSPVLLITLGILLLVYGILYHYIALALLAFLAATAFLILILPLKNKWLTILKSVLDTNISCLVGLFMAFKEEKVWERSEERRIP